VAGSAVKWLRDQLGIIATSAEIEGLARSVQHTAGVYFVPAFVGLGAPTWDPSARGALVGLTLGAGKAHVARAALEAVAYQTRDVIEAMRVDCPYAITELRADGGMANNALFLQMQADVLGLPVLRPRNTETTAFGAAMFASHGIGKPLEPDAQGYDAFEPRPRDEEHDSTYEGWKRAVERARSWAD
jgi:glycerol kinase